MRNERKQSRPLAVYSFARHLQDGETLLWQGKPVVSAYVWPKVLRDAVLVLPLVFAAMCLETLRSGSTIAIGSRPFWGISLFAYAFGTWALLRETRLQAESTCYALTDRRVLVRHLVTLPTQEKRSRVDDTALRRLRPRLLGRGRAVGSIAFGRSPLAYADGFRAIRDAEEVFRLLTEARAALPDAPAETPYYARQSVADAPAFDLSEHLRAGEAVLWRGAPNEQAYLRRIVRVEALSAVFLFALFGGLLMALHGVFTLPRLLGLAAAGGLVSTPVLWRAYGQSARRLSYFVTSRRVIIVKAGWRGGASVDERELAQTGKMRLANDRNGTGTLVFERHSRFIWHGLGGTVVTTEFSFKSIDDAAAVFALVTEARLALGVPARAVSGGRPAATV